MKQVFQGEFVNGRALVLCASEEERCTAIVSRMNRGEPVSAVILDYCSSADRGALDFLTSALEKSGVDHKEIVTCVGTGVVDRLRKQIDAIRRATDDESIELILDFTVIPRADLWMLLRWLSDAGLWERTSFLYTEPEDYSSVKSVPLSCGLSEIQALVGEPGVTDCSRPVHLVMQLGYEGDQALAVYEETQPAKATLLIPHPPFRPEWEGRTEEFNSQLLRLVGEDACRRVDSIDPTITANVVHEIVVQGREEESTIVCPLGTKPQLLGLFAGAIKLEEKPAPLIPRPLRAASTARARGVGQSWKVG